MRTTPSIVTSSGVGGATSAPATGLPTQSRAQPHPVDPRIRPASPPARRDLFATYLDHMRRRAGASAAPHHVAHAEFCARLRIPEHIGESLWSRWIRHYLRYGPDWS
jgi:hypothetical protein